MKSLRIITVLLFPVLLAGCSLFGSGEDVERPAELVNFDAQVRFQRVWRDNVGNGQGEQYNRLKPAIEADVIYVAANNGLIRAINRESGRRIWQTRLDYFITGGVGVDANYLYVGTDDARLFALNKSNGEIVWEAGASSEVLSVPASNGSVLVVQTNDDKLSGFNAATGQQLWIYENTVPALSVRGTSSPLITGDAVLAGFANGVLISVDVDNGTLNWDSRITVPTGRSEIERLVDVDAELFLDAAGLLVPSYQGFLSLLDVNTGQTLWRVAESSLSGASTGFGNIYLTDERGHVKAYRRGAQNDQVWVNDQLDLRQVSAPVSFGNYIAVGDFEGYLHLLSQVDGSFVGRIRIDSSGLRSIQSRNGILYAYGNSGDLVALRVETTN